MAKLKYGDVLTDECKLVQDGLPFQALQDKSDLAPGSIVTENLPALSSLKQTYKDRFNLLHDMDVCDANGEFARAGHPLEIALKDADADPDPPDPSDFVTIYQFRMQFVVTMYITFYGSAIHYRSTSPWYAVEAGSFSASFPPGGAGSTEENCLLAAGRTFDCDAACENGFTGELSIDCADKRYTFSGSISDSISGQMWVMVGVGGLNFATSILKCKESTLRAHSARLYATSVGTVDLRRDVWEGIGEIAP